jgi:hypothetical protein
MSFSLKKNNDVNCIFQNSATRNNINIESLKSEVTVNGEGPYKYIL